MDEMIKPAADAVRNGEIKLIPERMEKTYFNWTDNIRDWCISRQLWWGQRIPAYYLPDGSYVVEATPEEALKAANEIVKNKGVSREMLANAYYLRGNAYRQQVGLKVLSAGAQMAGASSTLQSLGSTVLGVGAQAWSSGFSRSQESEADHIGIIFAAMAGYDPEVAVSFWQRMAEASGGKDSAVSSIFSDHPSTTRNSNETLLHPFQYISGATSRLLLFLSVMPPYNAAEKRKSRSKHSHYSRTLRLCLRLSVSFFCLFTSQADIVQVRFLLYQ